MSISIKCLVYLLCLWWWQLSDAGIVVSPPNNQPVAINSTDNVTFVCNISDTDAGRASGEALWQVQDFQIPNGQNNALRLSFVDFGVIVEELVRGITRVTINGQAREAYRTRFSLSDPNTIIVRCIASAVAPNREPIIDTGEPLSIILFGAPLEPTDLTLTPNPSNLTVLRLSWTAPANPPPPGVEVTYVPSITGPSFNASSTTLNTSIIFIDDADLDCQRHTFSVFAFNPAGNSSVVSIFETIPISPNITALNESFLVTDVSLADPITLTLFFPLAVSCSQNFPILNYSLSIPSLSLRQLIVNTSAEQLQGNQTRQVQVRGLDADGVFNVSIEVCISIACQQSRFQVIRTTDVQSARIVFFENNIYISCTFASDSNAEGCMFQLTLSNGAETFILLRSSSNVSQCTQTRNQPDAFLELTVSDRERDGMIGMQSIVPSILILNRTSYITLTGCSIPEPIPPISPGAIAGIVIAVLVVGAAVVTVVVLLLVYRVKTGHWFRLEGGDEHMTANFEKTLLVDDSKLKAKKKSKVGDSSLGHSTTSSTREVITFQKGSEQIEASPPGEGEDTDGMLAKPRKEQTAPPNPDAAFTLDITFDKKVKLHLNRALIKRVLHEQNAMGTMKRNKPRNQQLKCKHELLPIHYCEVRVEKEEEN